MDPLDLIRVQPLMEISSGSPDIRIGLIDGPVDYTHSAFESSKITAVKESQLVACKESSSLACRHGTFVAGILAAKHGSGAPAMCPDCELLLRPIFTEHGMFDSIRKDFLFPNATPEELSDAIVEVVNAGANIINLSLGLSSSSLIMYDRLQEAYAYARRHGSIIVAASGNQGNIGNTSILHDQWIIPVAACDGYGRLASMSNFGHSIGIRGLMAPGININSTMSGGGYTKMSGTSFATPFVTGALALLWSIVPTATPAQLIYAIRVTRASNQSSRSIVPPLLNVELIWRLLKAIVKV